MSGQGVGVVPTLASPTLASLLVPISPGFIPIPLLGARAALAPGLLGCS